MRRGKKIEAIKEYRLATGARLKEAKDYVEEAQREPLLTFNEPPVDVPTRDPLQCDERIAVRERCTSWSASVFETTVFVSSQKRNDVQHPPSVAGNTLS
jgi:hypothetical protein